MDNRFPRHRDYKKFLSAAAAAWFRARGLDVSSRYSYCLSDWDCWPANIILPEVVAYVEQQRQERAANRQTFALHKFVHHGLSSQAMLFNLVGPLIVRRDLEPLHEAFTAAGTPWPQGDVTASLEVEDRQLFNERQAQPTSIDLVLEGGGRQALFVEAKLVEQEFGGCSVFEDGDCSGSNPAKDPSRCYLHRIGRRYWEWLRDLGFQETVAEGPTCPLISYYQFFREAVFAIAKGGDFVLLYDDRSPVFFRDRAGVQEGLMSFLTGFVPPEHRGRVHAVTIQAVAAAVRRSRRHDDWIGTFEEKYVLGGNDVTSAG